MAMHSKPHRKPRGKNRPKPAPAGLHEPIPAICTLPDLVRILRMSVRQICYLEARGTFPIPKITPSLDKVKRYRGIDVRRYLDGQDSSQVA